MSRPCVFEYLDYRRYLREAYEHAKRERPYFSYRFMAARVKINPGYIVKVLQGSVHLGVKNIPLFADLFALTGREREYFTELVHFGRAKTNQEIEQRHERLLAIKGLSLRTVGDNAVAFWREWHHMALRSLLSIVEFSGGSYRALGAMLDPPISAAQARESIRLQQSLGLLRRDSDGVYRVTDQFISTGPAWLSPAIRRYQKKMLDLAARSLDMHDKKLRDISTVTLTFSSEQLPLLRERIAEFRQELLRLSQEFTDDDSVMQLNMQLFPTAFTRKKDT